MDNRIFELVGPLTVICFEPERKKFHVQDVKIGNERTFNVTQVKIYHEPDFLAHSLISDMYRAFLTNGNKSYHEVTLTEVINDGDPRSQSTHMAN